MEQLVMNFEPYSSKTLHVTKYDNGDILFIGTKEDGTEYDANLGHHCVQNQLIKGICDHLFKFHFNFHYVDILDEIDMLIGYLNKSCFSIMFKKDFDTEFGLHLSNEQTRALLKFLL